MFGSRRPGRISAAILAVVLLFSLAPAVSGEHGAGVRALYLDSVPGEPIQNGSQATYTPPAHGFFASDVSTPEWVRLWVLGVEADSGSWNIDFAAPPGEILAVGTYEDAVSVWSRAEGQPGISFSGNGVGCNSSESGRFIVREIAFASDGVLHKLAVDFEHKCAPAFPSLFGAVRYDSTIAYEARKAQPVQLAYPQQEVGTTSGAKTVVVTNIGSAGLTIGAALTGTNPADFRISSNSCTGTLVAGADCAIAVRFRPTTTGIRNAILRISDQTLRGGRDIVLTGRGYVPASGTWQPQDSLGPNYGWNTGGSLVRTVTSGGTEYLHAAYTRSYINGWVTNSGPYLGTYYTRYRNGSETAPYRVNASTQHGDRDWLASAGPNVYVVWVSLAKIGDAYSPTAPRALYFRRNSNHGASDGWRTALRLTSSSGRVDYPSVAASGSSVYVAYTDSVSGYIKLAVSRDRGATWATKSIGTTTRSVAEGRAGIPIVTAAGGNLAVIWLSNSDRAAKARISRDSGATFASSVTLASATRGGIHAHALGTRVGFVWITNGGVIARIWQDGTWQAARTVSTFSVNGTYKAGYGTAIALAGTSGIGVSWADCRRTDCTATSTSPIVGVDLAWKESSTNGLRWNAKATLARLDPETESWRINDWPSIVWSNSSRRHVLWNAAEPDFYRLHVRRGDAVTTTAAGATTSGLESSAESQGRASPEDGARFDRAVLGDRLGD